MRTIVEFIRAAREAFVAGSTRQAGRARPAALDRIALEVPGYLEAVENTELRHLLAAVWEWNPRTDHVVWSESTRALLGYDPEELGARGSHWLELIHPDDRERVRSSVRASLEGDVDTTYVEYRIRSRDQGYLLVADHRVFERDAAGRVTRVIGAVRNVGPYREALRAIERSEREFRLLAEAIPQLVWTARDDGGLDYVNTRMTRFLGRPSEVVVGRGWRDAVHPDDLARTEEVWDGALARGEDFELEYRLRRADGAYRWFLVRGLPFREEDGRPRRWFGTCTEIEELKRLEAALREDTRFAEQLLGIVSHDLRNPLNAMLVGAQLLLRSGRLAGREATVAAGIVSAGRRANRLVGDLLDLTRARLGRGLPVERQPLDFDVVVRRAVDELRLASPDRTIRLRCGDAGIGVWDRDRLAQVVSNLVGNAVNYSPPGTPVEVETVDVGDRVELAVHNGGDPIPPDLVPRLFQPMQRGGNGRGGLGLGLFIVHRIVSAHGGSVSVHSTAEEGTTFRVSLPRHLVAEDAAAASAP